MKNSFNEMEEANIRSFYAGAGDKKVRKEVNSNFGTIRFLGNIADVYVNRLVETIVEIASGPQGEHEGEMPTSSRGHQSEHPDNSKYPNL